MYTAVGGEVDGQVTITGGDEMMCSEQTEAGDTGACLYRFAYYTYTGGKVPGLHSRSVETCRDLAGRIRMLYVPARMKYSK
jgi:hypothetical protein